MKRLLKGIGIFVLLLILIVAVSFWLITKEKYQNLIAKKATAYLSEKLHTKVEVAHVKISFLNDVSLQGIYVEDQQKDTLAYVGSLHLKSSELLKNWWNDEPPVIHTISLDDVYVHLNRAKDTTRWNYDFIAETFSSTSSKQNDSDTISVQEDSKSLGKKPILDLDDVELNRVRFIMDDAWRGEDMHYSFAKLDLKVNDFQLENKKVDIQELIINEANGLVREYDGGKPEDLTPDDTTTWGTPFNTEKFNIKCNNISIVESQFSYDDGNNIPTKNEFDEHHLSISHLNLNLKQTEIIDDTLYTQIKSMTAKERCGIEIKSLVANAKLSQVQSYLTNMLLETNNSLLKHHYEMNYKNFHDFNDYISKVNMKASIQGSNVSSIDIGYFANILNQYPISINLAGDVDGTVDHLVARNVSLSTLKTSFHGDATIKGLPNTDATTFDVFAKELRTNGNDLNKLIPQTKVDAVAWNKLSSINFKGNYKGKINEFKIDGQLNTNFGNSVVDLNMNFKPKIPSYSGSIETNNFDLGTLLKQKTIGKISMKGNIDGQGFDLNQLDARVNASVSNIQVEGVTYSKLTINGLVSNKKFDGIFISQDPNLAVNFDGKLDLTGKQPSYHFNTRFIKFDLQKMGISSVPMVGTGYASLNFTGDHIDNFVGTAVLKNVSLTTNGRNFYAELIDLSSSYVEGNKILKLESSMADAVIAGKFSISDLPSTFQQYLYHYLPQYIKRPLDLKNNQSFTYDVRLKNIASLITTFVPQLSGLDSTVISGNLNTQSQIFSLDAIIPQVAYQDFQLDSLQIVGAGDYKSFDLNAVTQHFYYKDEVIIPSMQLNSSMANDTASLTINTQSVNSLLGEASLNCKATAMNSNLYVNVLPSNININNLTWNLSCPNQLIFGKAIDVQNFLIESGPQRIDISTRQAGKLDVLANIENIDLENISQIVNPNSAQFLGHINGNIEVVDIQNDPYIYADLSSNDYMRIDLDTIGQVHAKVEFDVKRKLLKVDPTTSVTNYNSYANIEGSANANDSTIDIKANLSQLNISFLNQFLAEYIQNLKRFGNW